MMNKVFYKYNFLKKPKYTRKEWIYQAVDKHHLFIRGGTFLPTWDTTDHLHFVCAECKSVADILAVRFVPNYSKSDVKFALYFYLACPKCGATGQRKIYLDIRDNAACCQSTCDDKYLYFYADKREPFKISSLRRKGDSKDG